MITLVPHCSVSFAFAIAVFFAPGFAESTGAVVAIGALKGRLGYLMLANLSGLQV